MIVATEMVREARERIEKRIKELTVFPGYDNWLDESSLTKLVREAIEEVSHVVHKHSDISKLGETVDLLEIILALRPEESRP